jgi:hypothetical protein
MGLEEFGRREILCDNINAMSKIPPFFHLISRTMHPCYETKEAHAEAMRTTLCPGCAFPRPGVTSVDVRLQERSPRDKPLNIMFASGVGLVHRELLDLIGEDLARRELYLGRVFGNRGNEVADWVTFRGRNRVIVRGSKDAEYRTCKRCGRNIYHATGKRYLYPAPPSEATIFESDLSGLVLPPDVYDRVATRKWRKLGVDKLPVLDQPTDGLGTIPFTTSVP